MANYCFTEVFSHVSSAWHRTIFMKLVPLLSGNLKIIYCPVEKRPLQRLCEKLKCVHRCYDTGLRVINYARRPSLFDTFHPVLVSGAVHDLLLLEYMLPSSLQLSVSFVLFYLFFSVLFWLLEIIFCYISSSLINSQKLRHYRKAQVPFITTPILFPSFLLQSKI